MRPSSVRECVCPRLLPWTAVCFTLYGCTDQPPAITPAQQAAITRHPQNRLIPIDDLEIDTILTPDANGVLQPRAEHSSSQWLDVLSTLSPSPTSVGMLDGHVGYVIGETTDIATDDAHVYVLDGMYSEVKVYDWEGRFIMSLGKAGRGPGEFFRPTALTVYRDSILVVDRFLRAVLFSKSTEHGRSAITPAASTVPPHFRSPVDDVCFTSTHIYATEPHAGPRYAVTQYDRAWRVTAQFFQPYYSGARRLDADFRRARLLCDSTGIIVASLGAPHLIARFNEAGEALWITKLAGLKVPDAVSFRSGGYASRIPVDGVHTMASLWFGGSSGEFVLAQYRRTLPEGDPLSIGLGQDAASHITVMLSISTGAVLGVSTRAPIVLASRGNRLVTDRGTPYPSYAIYDLNSAGARATAKE